MSNGPLRDDQMRALFQQFLSGPCSVYSKPTREMILCNAHPLDYPGNSACGDPLKGISSAGIACVRCAPSKNLWIWMPDVDSNHCGWVLVLLLLDKYATRPNLENCFIDHFAGRVPADLHRPVS